MHVNPPLLAHDGGKNVTSDRSFSFYSSVANAFPSNGSSKQYFYANRKTFTARKQREKEITRKCIDCNNENRINSGLYIHLRLLSVFFLCVSVLGVFVNCDKFLYTFLYDMEIYL